MNLDLVSFFVVAPGAGPTACAVVPGDPAAVRNGADGSKILLLAAWSKAQAVGFSQVLFPGGHDLVRNLRWRNLANQSDGKLAFGFPQLMRAQDPFTVSESGSAVAGDVELVHALLWYENLPGVSGRLLSSADVQSKAVNLVTIEDTTTATVQAAYSGARALNAASALLKANTDYAVLGATVGAPCGTLTVRGTDSGNLRCGIPGLSQDSFWTDNWFAILADWYGIACIPVFNSANSSAIFVENVQDENLVSVPFSLNLVQLA
jgi:hypothetical protein